MSDEQIKEKIIRRPDYASGGITSDERHKMAELSSLWISRAFRTEPIDPASIISPIKELYRVTDIDEPRVAIASSPLSMIYAYGAACALLKENENDPQTALATPLDELVASMSDSDADAVYNSVIVAALNATIGSPVDYDDLKQSSIPSQNASASARRAARALHANCFKHTKEWSFAYQGGNMWVSSECFIAAARDILGLQLPEYKKYTPWEEAAIHGGPRVLHDKFCIVSDFPQNIYVDEENLPHCEVGPSHRWRDGWELYYWHNTNVPGHWINAPDQVSPSEILTTESVETRAAGISIVGMSRMLNDLPHNIIDSDPDPLVGDLIEVSIADLPETVLYLKFHCPRNGEMMEAVDRDALERVDLHHAHAWHARIPAHLYSKPSQRS